jgi:hypothetical protein
MYGIKTKIYLKDKYWNITMAKNNICKIRFNLFTTYNRGCDANV